MVVVASGEWTPPRVDSFVASLAAVRAGDSCPRFDIFSTHPVPAEIHFQFESAVAGVLELKAWKALGDTAVSVDSVSQYAALGRRLLDELYGEYGITRLTEGGLVNNVPARPAYAEVMKGRLGRRNPFVLAMDCFSTQSPSMLWFPIQQLVRSNVKANMPYMNLYFPFKRRLNPVNLVPPVEQLVKAMAWTTEELQPHMPFIETMCATLPVLRDR